MKNRHAYLHTRISILAGRLLPISAITSLILRPCEEFSREAAARATLEDLMTGRVIAPAAAERMLMQAFLQDFLILARPLQGHERDFLVYWMRKLEAANIKAMIRGKMAGLSADAIRAELADIRPFAKLPVEELLRAEDIAEMLRRLEKIAPYAEATRQARLVYEKKRELYILEATLDHRYLAGFWRRATELPEAERSELLPLVSRLLERFNLVWLLRFRFMYGLSPAETHYLLVAHHFHPLIGQDVGNLAQLPSLEEVLGHLPAPLQARLANARHITAIEQILEEMVREHARKALARSPSALTRAFAYLLLRECQMNRIVAVSKGRAMKLPAERIHDGVGLAVA